MTTNFKEQRMQASAPMDGTRSEIRFRFRGREVALSGFSPRLTLLDWLRDRSGRDRHERGLRRRRLRRLHGGAGAPHRRDDVLTRRSTLASSCSGRSTAPNSSRSKISAQGADLHPVQEALVDAPWLAMRLLHAGHRHEPLRATSSQRRDRLDRERGRRPARRQSLPLHRLSSDRRRGAGRA